ncbi:sugar-transfer associated ATP-grasp domain-containing protein [Winogradskyella poriferorum]|jgi:hypothetical protein|uniref:sugar-transfer associated ATP-grasp domain-containing protein n=1 Tax=Winogradskyella poriferorum TaxID=307627 RepID=UPI003D6513AA
MKELAKSLIEKSKSFVYHKEHHIYASKVLKVIESQRGKLDSKNKKLCKEYASDVFGHKKYAPWLITYSSFHNEFKEGWIPDNYYGEIVVPKIKGNYGEICNRTLILNKLIDRKFSTHIGYYINDLFVDLDNIYYQFENFKEMLFKNNSKIVFKAESSFQGKGVYVFNETSFNYDNIKKLGDGVFQKYIEQHQFFNQFNKSAVATIRLTSARNKEGEIEIRAGFFKFGRENDTHVKSTSALKIPFDIKTGELHDKVFFPDWTYADSIPEKKLSFYKLKFPNYEQCVLEIIRLHKTISYIGCIGWDFVVDNNNNLKIIELNGGHNGIWFDEMVKGPCFKGLGWEKLHKTT